MRTLSTILIICVFFVSCATSKKKSENRVISSVKEEVQKDVAEQVNVVETIEKRLEQITDDAIAAGEETVNLLASDLFFKPMILHYKEIRLRLLLFLNIL